MPALTSRICSSAGVASAISFVSATRTTAPASSRTTRPYPRGSSRTLVTIVATAPLRSCATVNAPIASVLSSGTSPLSTSTGPSSPAAEPASRWAIAAATAPPVPSATG
jgi:hypothetical protein